MSRLKMSTVSNEIEKVLVPSGLHQAVCIGFVDCGTLNHAEFGPKRKCELTFEFPHSNHDFGEGEVPLRLTSMFTMSMHPKGNLAKTAIEMTNMALPEEFDPTDLIGINSMVNVRHTEPNSEGKIFANIVSYSPLMHGTVPVSPVKTWVFLFDDWKQEEFDVLPEWKQDRLKLTPEYKELEEKNFAPF